MYTLLQSQAGVKSKGKSRAVPFKLKIMRTYPPSESSRKKAQEAQGHKSPRYRSGAGSQGPPAVFLIILWRFLRLFAAKCDAFISCCPLYARPVRDRLDSVTQLFLACSPLDSRPPAKRQNRPSTGAHSCNRVPSVPAPHGRWRPRSVTCNKLQGYGLGGFLLYEPPRRPRAPV